MASDKIKNLDSNNFQEVVGEKGKPVLVDFWAPWCGPCKMIAPILDELAEELGEKAQIAKVDIDDNQEIASQFGVRSIPTLIVFKDGQPVETMIGMTDKATLTSKLETQML